MSMFNKGKKLKPQLLVSIFIIVIAVLVFLLIVVNPKEEKPSENDSALQEQENNIEGKFLESQEELSFLFERETFLSENLSTLSPEKEVLGGSFYLTNVYWQDMNSAIIEYEDGHIALRAKVVFAEGFELESFEMLPEEIE